MDTSAATSSPDAAVSLSWVVNSVRDWVERCSSIWVEAQIIELKRR
ncbi:MAG: exodeoxyribonuclease VII large subunit, partial [Cutibacterium granulosum]|nr:exodeoxyribonuclease VII large subunit [Cutibacterium granulosum]